MPRVSLLPTMLLAAMLLAALGAVPAFADSVDTAPNAVMRYISLDMQRDSEQNHQTVATLSLTAGDHVWWQLGGGKTRSLQEEQGSVSPTLWMAGIGIAGQAVQFTLNGTQYRDGDNYRQRDLNASIEWHNAVVTMGVDGMHRNTTLNDVFTTTGTNGNVFEVPITQDISGHGVGLHASFNFNDHWSAGIGGMKYSYDSEASRNGDVVVNGGNNPVLTLAVDRLLEKLKQRAEKLVDNASAVNRNQALLDRSFNLSLTHQWKRASLSAQYFNDRAFETEELTRSYQLIATALVGEHWMLSPGIGVSQSDSLGDIRYGMLSVSYNW